MLLPGAWLQGVGAADTRAPSPTFTPGRYCTGENVSTKDHMAPFCTEPLDKGAGKPPEGTLLEGSGPAPQTAGCRASGENGGTSSCQPGCVQSHTGSVLLSRSYSLAAPTLLHCSSRQKRWQTLVSTRCLSLESRKPPSCPGTRDASELGEGKI